MMPSKIALVRAAYDTIYEDLVRVFDLADGPKPEPEASVVIKINLCDARTVDTGAITHPLSLDALMRCLRERYEGLKLYVVESDGEVAIPEKFMRWFGFLPALERWNARFVNLSEAPADEVMIKGWHFKSLPVPYLLKDSYFITMAKLKTNALSQITCALKNQFGCLPMTQKGVYHSVLDDAIVDANLAYTPHFCIVDGIVGQGGVQGPAFGIPIHAGALITGHDPVAVDSLCAQLIGFNPKRVGHIRKAAASGLGSMEYIQVGDELPQVDFEIRRLETFIFRLGAAWKRRSLLLHRQAAARRHELRRLHTTSGASG